MCSIVSRLKRWLMTLLGEFGMTAGDFGNVGKARYAVPDMWTMGEVYARPWGYLAGCYRQSKVVDG